MIYVIFFKKINLAVMLCVTHSMIKLVKLVPFTKIKKKKIIPPFFM